MGPLANIQATLCAPSHLLLKYVLPYPVGFLAPIHTQHVGVFETLLQNLTIQSSLFIYRVALPILLLATVGQPVRLRQADNRAWPL